MLLPPPHEVPHSPFDPEGGWGAKSQTKEAKPGPSRSGSNGHDAGMETNSPTRNAPPPAAWPLIPRSRTRRSGPQQQPSLTKDPILPTRIAQRSLIVLASIPKAAQLPPWTAAPVLRGKAPRRQISRQSSKALLLHSSPAALFQIYVSPLNQLLRISPRANSP